MWGARSWAIVSTPDPMKVYHRATFQPDRITHPEKVLVPLQWQVPRHPLDRRLSVSDRFVHTSTQTACTSSTPACQSCRTTGTNPSHPPSHRKVTRINQKIMRINQYGTEMIVKSNYPSRKRVRENRSRLIIGQLWVVSKQLCKQTGRASPIAGLYKYNYQKGNQSKSVRNRSSPNQQIRGKLFRNGDGISQPFCCQTREQSQATLKPRTLRVANLHIWSNLRTWPNLHTAKVRFEFVSTLCVYHSYQVSSQLDQYLVNSDWFSATSFYWNELSKSSFWKSFSI